MTCRNLLLTGPPGCGKTTAVRQTARLLPGLQIAGFYTEELRESGHRVGFRIIGFGGRDGILAHVELPGPVRVSRYGVDLAALERISRAELTAGADLYIIDEIGKMECASPVFVEAARRVLDSPAPVLATVALKGGGFIAEVKRRSDIEWTAVTAALRDHLPTVLAARIRELLGKTDRNT